MELTTGHINSIADLSPVQLLSFINHQDTTERACICLAELLLNHPDTTIDNLSDVRHRFGKVGEIVDYALASHEDSTPIQLLALFNASVIHGRGETNFFVHQILDRDDFNLEQLELVLRKYSAYIEKKFTVLTLPAEEVSILNHLKYTIALINNIIVRN